MAGRQPRMTLKAGMRSTSDKIAEGGLSSSFTSSSRTGQLFGAASLVSRVQMRTASGLEGR